MSCLKIKRNTGIFQVMLYAMLWPFFLTFCEQQEKRKSVLNLQKGLYTPQNLHTKKEKYHTLNVYEKSLVTYT